MAINLLPWREQIIVQRTRLYGLLLIASIIIIKEVARIIPVNEVIRLVLLVAYEFNKNLF